MSLKNIQNELYSKGNNADVPRHAETEFDPRLARQDDYAEKYSGKDDAWEEQKVFLGKEEKSAIRKGAYALGAILLLLISVAAFYLIRNTFFSADRVTMEMDGPKTIRSGSLVTYEIDYGNNNRASLKDMVLRLSYPSEFKPEGNPEFKEEGTSAGVYNLGDLIAHGSGKVVFNGRVYSSKGAFINIKANFSYMPSTISSRFEIDKSFPISIASSPMTLEVVAPQNIANQDQVNYLINYKNTGAEDHENIRIKVDYPSRFTYSNADPRPLEGNNIWYVGHVSAGQSGKIVVSGKLEGNQDDVGTLHVLLGANNNGEFVSYSEESTQTKIIASSFSIAQTVNGLDSLNINAGQNLKFELRYKNQSNLGLKDVIVTEYLDSPVLDYQSLETDGGYYDAQNKTITWKASDHPDLKNLAPGQEGKINFSVTVKDVVPVTGSNDKNFVVSSLVKIDSPDVPTPIHMNKIVAGNKMDLRLNSKLILDVKGYYTDAKIPNSGPVPPQVGQETTYTMHFLLSNVSNDITDAKVEAVLPTGISMTDKVFPEGSPLAYNDRTHSVVWTVGNIDAGTGIINSPKEIAFQIKLKPYIDQVGDRAILLQSSNFTAKDSFTGEDLLFTAKEKTTMLTEDVTINNSNFKIVN